MPPHVLLKTTFGTLEKIETPDFEQKEVVRTDFILSNIFAYGIKEYSHPFPTVCSINSEEEYVLEELKVIYDSFLSSYEDNINVLCCDIQVNKATVGCILRGVFNQLFDDGITWSRIVSFFVFVRILTLQCISRKLPDTIIDVIYECFCILVKEDLKFWIDEHGNWEGLTMLSETQGNTNSLKQPQSSNSTWTVRGAFLKALQVVGTLTKVANVTYGFP